MARKPVTDDLFSISFSKQDGEGDKHKDAETRPYYLRLDTQINRREEITFHSFEHALQYLEDLHKKRILQGCTSYNTGDGRNWTYAFGGYPVLGDSQSIYIGKTLAQELYERSKQLKSDEMLWIED